MYELKKWKCHAGEPTWQTSRKNSIIRSLRFTQNLIMVMSSFKIWAEVDKIWDKAWRAQQAHVHRPKEGNPLCGPLTERRPRFAHQVSDSWKLALQGEDLLCKDETCSARMRLALQREDLLYKEKRQDLTTIKSPNILIKRYAWLTPL